MFIVFKKLFTDLLWTCIFYFKLNKIHYSLQFEISTKLCQLLTVHSKYTLSVNDLLWLHLFIPWPGINTNNIPWIFGVNTHNIPPIFSFNTHNIPPYLVIRHAQVHCALHNTMHNTMIWTQMNCGLTGDFLLFEMPIPWSPGL